MDAVSPALADAHRLLRMDLYGYLDEAEFLSTKLSPWSTDDAGTARNLIPDLTMVVRGILVDHPSTADGNCSMCRTTWPCHTVNTIHGLIKDPEHEFVKIMNRAKAAANA
jgi:hypothetical protein